MTGTQRWMSASELAGLSDDLQAVFLCEGTELLARLDETLALLAVELGPAHIAELVRLLHTLKGAAAAAGELKLRDKMHALEDRAQALQVIDFGAAQAILVTLSEDLSRVRSQLEVPTRTVGPHPVLRRTPQGIIEALHGAVRDAARDCGKAVRLVVHSETAAATALDPPLIMQVFEPLLHLVRNAVVHGIEAESERRRLGKDPVGTVVIDSHCAGQSGQLWVADDGAGIELGAVRKRAAQRGCKLPPSDGKLSAEALLDVLCQPGFSTREHVDVLAGRGVGLSAVRRAMQELAGTLSLYSVAGSGCIFTLELPLAK